MIKHDAHDFEIDKEGKDTYRFTKSGADVVVISSKTHAAIMENRYLTLEKILDSIHDVDLIIIEGFKNESQNFRRIGLTRADYELPEGKNFIAVISDKKFKCDVPVFDINDYYGFAEWLVNDIQLLQLS